MRVEVCSACGRGDHKHCLGGGNTRPSLIGSGWICACALAKHKLKIKKEKDPMMDALDKILKKKERAQKKRKKGR